jgi:hypothetical protein
MSHTYISLLWPIGPNRDSSALPTVKGIGNQDQFRRLTLHAGRTFSAYALFGLLIAYGPAVGLFDNFFKGQESPQMQNLCA